MAVKYYMYLQEEGEGCDYTIGCGQTLRELLAQTQEEALAEAHEYTVGKLDEDGDYEPAYFGPKVWKKAIIIPVDSIIPIPTKEWQSELNKAITARDSEQQTSKERAEFERLKAQFE